RYYWWTAFGSRESKEAVAVLVRSTRSTIVLAAAQNGSGETPQNRSGDTVQKESTDTSKGGAAEVDQNSSGKTHQNGLRSDHKDSIRASRRAIALYSATVTDLRRAW